MKFLIDNWMLIAVALASGSLLAWPTVRGGAAGGVTPPGSDGTVGRVGVSGSGGMVAIGGVTPPGSDGTVGRVGRTAGTFTILDDGPTATLNSGAVATARTDAGTITLTVDESAGSQKTDANQVDNVADRRSTADFSNLFDADGNAGTNNTNYGTDGPGHVAYALSLFNVTGNAALLTTCSSATVRMKAPKNQLAT